MTTKQTFSVPNLQRGMAVLEFLASQEGSATIAELSERLGIPTASAFRITGALTEMGYLRRDPASKRFSLTNKLLLLGQPLGRDRGLVESALPAMRGLRKATGETTQLCCLVETDIVVLEQLVALHPFKYTVDLGARVPSYSCAPGKAIIAHLPPAEREELIERLPFKRFTPNTITSRRAFREEIEQIIQTGYALDRAEGLEGIHCVAAAIRGRDGYAVGGLTIAGPSSRLPESAFERLGEVVNQAASKAEHQFLS
ncbi:Transcriptional regulator KdgR [Planctomycetes bacterium Pan216]|uniref:Transcriptional regulator KdgR n=1 Tax=Kolteria novifilia TaxID=2527975 RepID=A0A518AXD6_9BACT|nr:Transcriptional regulator KdgR [Planctomycetes bacterium Pan216]